MSITAYLYLLVIMGFFMGMLPFAYFIFRDPDLKTLFINSLPFRGYPLAIVANEVGKIRFMTGKIENGIFQAKKHAFKVAPSFVYRTLGVSAIIGYTGFGGAINLIMPKFAEKVEVKDNPGELVVNDIKIPAVASVSIHQIRKLMEQNLPSSTLKEVEILTKAKAKAGMQDTTKVIVFVTTLLVVGAIAVYILSMAAAQGGGISFGGLGFPGGISP